MKTSIKAICLGSLLLAGTHVMADDSTTSPNAMTQDQKKQMWNDCMAKQKAANASLTQAAMETNCKNEMKKNKMQKDGNDLATGPQTTPGKE
jgi:hypothetical protein